MNGGLLIQNVGKHAGFGTHQIIHKRNDMERYDITSTHHQMQYPFNLERDVDYTTLYYSQRRSPYYEGDKVDYPPHEPEIVLYHKKDMPKCLAIQGHPEMMRDEAPVIKMLNQLVDQYVA